MSLIDLKKDELLEAAEFYDVDVNQSDNKQEIVDALEERGVTEEMWKSDKPSDDEPADEPEQPAEEEEEDLVLVRFVGNNRSYSVGKHSFSPKLRPFGLLSRSQFETLPADKFREASADEAAEFYGQ